MSQDFSVHVFLAVWRIGLAGSIGPGVRGMACDRPAGRRRRGVIAAMPLATRPFPTYGLIEPMAAMDRARLDG